TTQRFPKGITVAEISRRCATMLDELLEGQDEAILSNPLYHLNIMVVKSLRLLQLDHPRALGLGLGGVIGSNLLGRRHLKRWFERVIIHDTRLAPPLGDLDDFVTSYVSLSTDNLRPALLASGSIPMVMEAVRDIPGASEGVYRDGGLLDCHLDLPWLAPALGQLDDVATSYGSLGTDSLRPALLASGSIPMVMEAVRDIPGASEGVYRDGGLLDYHLDLPWRAPGGVLYPPFIDRVVP